MLIKQQILEQIAQGSVSLAFRRGQRPTVRAGGQLRTAVGVLAIDAIDVVTLMWSPLTRSPMPTLVLTMVLTSLAETTLALGSAIAIVTSFLLNTVTLPFSALGPRLALSPFAPGRQGFPRWYELFWGSSFRLRRPRPFFSGYRQKWS